MSERAPQPSHENERQQWEAASAVNDNEGESREIPTAAPTESEPSPADRIPDGPSVTSGSSRFAQALDGALQKAADAKDWWSMKGRVPLVSGGERRRFIRNENRAMEDITRADTARLTATQDARQIGTKLAAERAALAADAADVARALERTRMPFIRSVMERLAQSRRQERERKISSLETQLEALQVRRLSREARAALRQEQLTGLRANFRSKIDDRIMRVRTAHGYEGLRAARAVSAERLMGMDDDIKAGEREIASVQAVLKNRQMKLPRATRAQLKMNLVALQSIVDRERALLGENERELKRTDARIARIDARTAKWEALKQDLGLATSPIPKPPRGEEPPAIPPIPLRARRAPRVPEVASPTTEAPAAPEGPGAPERVRIREFLDLAQSNFTRHQGNPAALTETDLKLLREFRRGFAQMHQNLPHPIGEDEKRSINGVLQSLDQVIGKKQFQRGKEKQRTFAELARHTNELRRGR